MTTGRPHLQRQGIERANFREGNIMFNPIDGWKRWNGMAMAMMTNGAKMGEAWMASGRVIDQRMDLIRADAGSPAARAEMARMLPEKMEALGESSQAAMREFWALHGDMMRLGQDMATSALLMQPPSQKAVRVSLRRTQKMADRMTRATTAMVAPWHSAVTANDRRLTRKK
jgi:hypothetical protein